MKVIYKIYLKNSNGKCITEKVKVDKGYTYEQIKESTQNYVDAIQECLKQDELKGSIQLGDITILINELAALTVKVKK